METSAEPWSVLKLINWTKDYLAKAYLESPRLSAEILLAHALHCRRIDLYTRYDYQPTAQELAEFRQLVQRAGQYEPIAYMVGEKEFYSLRFKVTPDVLVPRPETEMLVAEALSHLRQFQERHTVWDVCTGSGCVAVAIASQSPQASVLATDISPSAVAVAQENAQANRVADRVRCRVADLLSLADEDRDLCPFAAITANPPYIADNQMISETVRREPPIAVHGGPSGLDFLERIIRDAPAFLRPGGALILEFGYTQEDVVSSLILATGQFLQPRVIADHQGIDRNVIAIRR